MKTHPKQDSTLSATDAPLDTSPVQVPLVPKERYDLRILGAIRRIIRSVDVYSRKLAKEYGVTVPQLICMLKIDELGPLTIKDLASEVYLSPSTLVGIIDRLENQDLIFRERSVRDRRRVRISLSDAGKKIVANSPSPLQDALATSIARLPELERATIALSLEKIIGLMEEKTSDVPTDPSAPILETREKLESLRGEETL